MDSSGPPPSPNETQIDKYYGVTIPFLSIMLIIYSARMYTRRHNFFLEDLFITLAVFLEIIAFGLEIRIFHVTGGRHIMFVPKSVQPTETLLGMIAFFVSMWSISFVKVSIASMLLRFKSSNWWRLSLWGLIIVSIATAIAGVLSTVFECKPISAQWDHSKFQTGATCSSQRTIVNRSYIIQSIFVFTDFVLALMPLSFIVEMNRPLREKLILASLMGTGLIAMVCGIIKLVQLSQGYRFADLFFYLPVVAIWIHLEALLGIIAACVPILKAPFEKLLGKFGVNVNATPSGMRYTIRDLDATSETSDEPKNEERSASKATV